MNTFSYLFLAFLISGLVLQCYLSRRHIKHIKAHRAAVPEAFRESISLEAHQKAADYSAAKTTTALAELFIGAGLLLLWTFGGLLEYIDQAVRAGSINWGLADLWAGALVMLAVLYAAALLDLPLSLYRAFALEQRYGFNKMTARLFITDQLKNAVLLLLIGTPMLLLALWIMASAGGYWWLYVWLAWLVFSLIMLWAYPAFIAPLFNQFKPLANAALKTRIEELLRRNGFASRGIFVMDGSARSTHGNAYFTGLGDNKRIVFFDTLIDKLSIDEIEAVLAHELGHFKCKHIQQRMVIMAALLLLGFAMLGQLINMPWFYSGLGISTPSAHTALILFFMVAPTFIFMLQPLLSHTSRRHEFEADDFAAGQAQAASLTRALVKLYKENANTLTPDPLYSAFHDSHPPAPVRIAHLQAK